MVLYLSDVQTGGGGFTVWPGSHLVLRGHFQTLGTDLRKESFDKALAQVHRTTPPYEISGSVGTVIFWHHRLAHTSGVNTSRTVRHATLCDFRGAQFSPESDAQPNHFWEGWSSEIQKELV